MTVLRLESTKGTVLLNLNNVAGALLTETDDGVEFIALTMIVGANVKVIICLSNDVEKLDSSDVTNHTHTIALIEELVSGNGTLAEVMHDIERGKSAGLLIALLFKQGISANITQGGVTIVYKRHQRKDMLDTLNGMRELLSRVDTKVYLDYKKCKLKAMYVVRNENKPISVSHKRN